MDEKRSILIVDDDVSICRSLMLILEGTGYVTETARTGQEALEKARKRFFNLALLDMKLPDIQGVELIVPLKGIHPDMEIIIVTAYASLETAVNAMHEGASAYITKPVDMDAVLGRVTEALEKQHLTLENRRLYQGVKEELSRRELAEQALKVSESKYMALVENSPDIIYMLDPQGQFSFVGGAARKLLGVSPEDLVGKHFTSVVWPEDKEKAHFHFNERRTGKRATRRLELRLAVERGTKRSFDICYVPAELHAFGMYDKSNTEGDKKFLGTYGVARDITARKKAEDALKRTNEELLKESKQRKLLSKRLIRLLESDRRQVAMELHDHVGQTLTSLKMDLERIAGEVESEAATLAAIQHAQDNTFQAMEDIHKLARGLRPTTLETLGLVPTLRGLFNDMEEYAGIEIDFFPQNAERRFDGEKELAIFRIAQEGMTNVVRHARAKKAHVSLAKDKDSLSLSIEDDGIGFDKSKAMKISGWKGPLGLLIMEERAVQVGGEFSLESRTGGGTHLLARIPV